MFKTDEKVGIREEYQKQAKAESGRVEQTSLVGTVLVYRVRVPDGRVLTMTEGTLEKA